MSIHKILSAMIQILTRGDYVLLETKGGTKILVLDDASFAWVTVTDIGEILVTSHKAHKADYILSKGKYRLYKVKNEPKYVDQVHLELLIGCGEWQGYLLPNGLPTDIKKRNRLIPTSEIITKTGNCEECTCEH